MARIATIASACELLVVLRDNTALTLPELAEHLGEPVGTVRNWADTLAAAGFVKVHGVGDKRFYAPGDVLLTYARDYTTDCLVRFALRAAPDAANTTRETHSPDTANASRVSYLQE